MTDLTKQRFPSGVLFLGDCLKVMPRIPEGFVDAVITDPPYGTTQCKWDAVVPFEPMWSELLRVTSADSAICLFAQNPFSAALISSNPSMFKYNWVWEKPQGTGHLNAKKYPLKNHEDICVFCSRPHFYDPQFDVGKPYKQKSGRGSENYGDQVQVITDNEGIRYPKTVLKFTPDRDKVHPTQKPVDLLRYLIRTYTKKDEVVLDFTCGSGTTLVAAVLEGRKFIGIEKEEKYFDIACRRVQDAIETI